MAKAFWKCLQYCDKCFGKLFGVCGYSRKSRGIYRDVCASCAGLSAFAMTFARAAQVSRHLPRRLRKLRKSLGICHDVCAGCASLSAFALTFAGVPRGISKDTLAVTTLYQRHSPGIKIPHSFVELTLGIILSCRGGSYMPPYVLWIHRLGQSLDAVCTG